MNSSTINRQLTVFVIFITSLLMSFSAYATLPNITGTYSGTLKGTEANCGPANGGPFTGGPNALEPSNIAFTINIFDQNTGAFQGSGTGSDGETIFVAGIVNASGIVSSSGFAAVGSEITTTGVFDGSQFTDSGLQFVASGVDADNTPPNDAEICLTVNISTTLVRVSGNDIVIVPEISDSSTITGSQTLITQVQGITSEVGGRVGNILRGGGTGFNLNENSVKLEGYSDGLNAGDEIAKGIGFWASYSRSEFENDFAALAFEGNRNNIVTGIDYTPTENMVVGIALGYEFSDIDTKVNRGNVETDGFSVIPYFGYLLGDTFSIDASIGYSSVESDQFRTAPGTSTRITSSPHSDRFFGTLNASGIWFYGNWIFGGNIGYLWANSIQEGFTESDGTVVDEVFSELGQWNVGGNIAYLYKERFEPYVSLTYNRDYSMTEIVVASGTQPSNDDDDFLFGTGLRYYGSNGIVGNLEYSRRFDRDNFEEYTINATLRIDF